VHQGNTPRDEFPPDSPHRHPGTGCRDFPLGFEDGSGKAREFAGVLAVEVLRYRTRDSAVQGRLEPVGEFVSVAKFGGSGSEPEAPIDHGSSDTE
jgi:hypothetical protein